MKIITTLLTVMVLAGCAGVPSAPAEADRAAKRFDVLSDRALVYIYNSDYVGPVNQGLRITLYLDGRIKSQLGPAMYAVWALDPGAHDIVAKTANISHLTIHAKAKHIYYVYTDLLSFRWTYHPKVDLQLVDESEGRAQIEWLRLAESL